MLQPFADAHRIYHVIEPALRAPSVYNTQPWSFRIVADDRIELRASAGGETGTGPAPGDGTCCCIPPRRDRGPGSTRSAAARPC